MFSVYTTFSQTSIFKHFTTRDGLPHDITYGIIQDSDGLLWIGTDDGLTRFDGRSFKNYGYENGLKSNYVIDIVELKKNEFAIATWGGGLHYFKNDTIIQSNIVDDEISKINILGVLNNGDIYANSNRNNFYLYQSEERKEFVIKSDNLNNPDLFLKKQITDRSNINSFQTALNGNLYIHASEKINPKKSIELKGVFMLNKNTLSPVFGYLKDKLIFSVSQDKSHFYLGSTNSIYIGSKKQLKEVIKFNFKNNSKIIHIKKHNNSLFFITNDLVNSNRKLYKYNLTSKQLTSLSDYLKTDKMISDFIFDRQNNLWVTTYGDGAFVVPNTSNSFYSTETFSNNDIKDAQIINNELYLLATNTFYHFNNNHITDQKKVPFLTESFVYHPKNNTLNFIVSRDKQLKEKALGFNFNYVSQLDYRFFNIPPYKAYLDNFTLSIYKNEALHQQISCNSTIKKLEIKNNRLYALSSSEGLIIYDLVSGKILKKFNQNSNIQTKRINNFIVSDRDQLFLATNKGIYAIKNDSIQQFTTKNGLESNHVNDIALDKHNVLWIGTQKGLNVMLNDTFYTISETLGQKSSFITKVLIKDNNVFATGNQGLFKYNNALAFTPNSLPPLKVNQNKSVFTIQPISLLYGKTLKVSYKIDNTNWVETPYDILNFEYLNQGKHQIVFRYKDNISDWSVTQPYYFTIIYPWHSQSWFYALITMLICLIITFISYYLLKKSIKKNKELKNTIDEKEKLKQTLSTVRKNLAQDFHDELGNKLASITMITNLLMIKNPEKNDNYNKLEKIKEDSNYLYSGMKDFIWSLNHESDNLDEVLLYITEFGKNLYNNTEITFYVETEMNKTHVTLPYYWSKQIIFIFKEAMTNALKHSNASEVTFSFSLINKELALILTDNGIGFKDHLLERKNGLLNMQNRAKKINSSLTVKSNNEKTIVTFTGKLH
ncbi:two component regulator with propeller domain [Tenacibaculum caenipelagi]|uniref:histidine kinase n=1 Tax=Tenacibaculum caenipelagi TaxID=1325435 RepID=A0A4R6TK19_9FLAO|nr:two component regulator with propeller domain [Tenacibaculum caenipelagi]